MEPNPYQSPTIAADVPPKKSELSFVTGAVLTLLIVPTGLLAIVGLAIAVDYCRSWFGF